jgi:Skp family chaperone for outer membrane proteins
MKKGQGMRNKLYLILMVGLLYGSALGAAQEPRATKIGKVNLALLSAMHPQMGLFDFQRMGFVRAELGLKREAYEGEIMMLKRNRERRLAAEARMAAAEAELQAVQSRLRELHEAERTTYLPDMSEGGQAEFKVISELFRELGIKRREAEFEMQFPEMTGPRETREILNRIEAEVREAVRAVAEEGGYDVVLNQSVPTAYGYEVTYRPEATFSTGPVGLEQVNYYTLLSVRPEGRAERADAEVMAQEWLSGMFRPSTQDYLPVKPWPLVLSGGDDLFAAALKRLFEAYEINSVTFEVLMDVLSKENSSF